MEALEGNFDVRLVTFEFGLVYSVLCSFKFKTKGGKFTEHEYRVHFTSPITCNHLEDTIIDADKY